MDLSGVLEFEPTTTGFVGQNLRDGPGTVVFGGQLLAQSLVAAARTLPSKNALSLHCTFARGARPEEPVEFAVDKVADGRSFGVVTVTVSQGSRICARSLVHMHVADRDLIRHQIEPPIIAPPDRLPQLGQSSWWDVRCDASIDISDPDTVGPARLDLWSRFPRASGDLPVSQAFLAYASDMYLIGTAMRPHHGLGQSLAHTAVSTTVLNQTINFHEPFDASDWLLLAHESPYAGRGRSLGRAAVFSEDGRLVATFAQQNMIRAYASDRRPPEGARSAY